MAYIGVQPADAYTSFAVQHFTTSATTSYTLDNSVANENEIALFINNVRQQPGSSYAYTASGTTLTLSAATSASDTMYCVFIGKAVQTVTPANNSVTGDMLVKPFTYDDASNGSVTGISVNNDYPTTSTASAGTGSGIRFGVNDGSFTSAFGDARGSEILSVTQQSNGRTRDIVFKTDNAGTLGEKMRILASGGITFNGDTASANALDDYEEGTWTPEYTGDSGSFSSVTYDSFRAGRYTKIGRMVFAYGFIRTDAISLGTLSGTLKVTGLPFTALSTGQPYKFMVALGTRHNFNGAIEIVGSAVNDNSTEFFLTKDYNTGSSVQVTDLGTGTNQNHLQFTAIYETA